MSRTPETTITHSQLANNQIEVAKASLHELKHVIEETYTDVREEIFNLRAKVLTGMDFMEVLNRYIDKCFCQAGIDSIN